MRRTRWRWRTMQLTRTLTWLLRWVVFLLVPLLGVGEQGSVECGWGGRGG
jgi:hypothetical protein